MSMRANASRLTAISRDLTTQWAETRNYWRDAKSAEFHRRFIVELLASSERTVAIMEQLDKLLERIKDDCE